MASYETSIYYELYYKDAGLWVKLGSIKYSPDLAEYVFVSDGNAVYLTDDDVEYIQTKLYELNEGK